MSMNKMQMPTYADLLKLPVENDDSILEVSLSEIHSYEKGNRFRVVDDDDEMLDALDSIEKNGVIQPAIVRKREEGGYELIAGHRRKRACELLGWKTMPVIVRDYDDQEAESVMNESNLHRTLRPSEIASICKNKMENMSHQGVAGEYTADHIGRRTDKSARTVFRYARLMNLLPELLDLIDDKKLGKSAGTSISYLPEEKQRIVLQFILDYHAKISDQQAKELKELHFSGELDEQRMQEVLFAKPKPKVSKKVVFGDEIYEYFSRDIGTEQIRDEILAMLDCWMKHRGEE